MKQGWFSHLCRSGWARAEQGGRRLFRAVLAMLRRFGSAAWTPVSDRFRAATADRARRITLVKHSVMIPTMVFILLLIHEQVFSYMNEQTEYRIEYKALHRVSVPGWLRGSLVNRETAFLDLPAGDSLISPETVEKVKRALEGQAWIEKVVSVERVFPSRLRVAVQYRRPLVAISRGGRYYFVDHSRTRLPGTYASLPKIPEGIYTAAGVRTPPPEPGEVWKGDDLQAACEMARLLDEHGAGRKFRIAQIDVSNMDGRVDRKKGEVVLKTAAGLDILWGNAPTSKRFGGIGFDERIRNLEKVEQKYPSFRGLRYVKVYAMGRAVVGEESNLANR